MTGVQTCALPILVATGLGFLAGMGVGGGSLLLLWLTQIAGMEQPQARLINLLFYLPAALIATYFHRKEGRLCIRTVFPGMVAGCICASAFSVLSGYMQMDILKKLLGGLLILTGLREIFYRRRKAR